MVSSGGGGGEASDICHGWAWRLEWWLTLFLITVDSTWNVGETGDIYFVWLEHKDKEIAQKTHKTLLQIERRILNGKTLWRKTFSAWVWEGKEQPFVVYFDQPMGAPHTLCWSKDALLCFLHEKHKKERKMK